jgi:hypothetical protein
MASMMDKVHTVGMSENGSTYLTVDAVNGVRVEPPIIVTFEGENAHVAVVQEAMAARYHDDELRQIGEGNATLGLNRVIGDIAMNGPLEFGATKPLHPNLNDGDSVAFIELPAPRRQLTA